MNKKNKEHQSKNNPPALRSESEKIWNEIKNLKLEMFTLPNQFVYMYYKPITIDPAKLHLTALTSATSVLPALENALYPQYQVEQVDRFILVTLAPVKK